MDRRWCLNHVEGLGRWSTAIFLALLLAGCRPQPPEAERTGSGQVGFSDQLSAEQILANTIKAYAQANAYQDAGKIYLSYRLNGQLIQEQQPWQTSWARERGLLGHWFNAEIQFDAARLRCYVYDNETQNLDQQCLMIEAVERRLPLTRLLSDAMASYFVGGRSEMPLHAPALPHQGALTTPVIDWLENSQPWEIFTAADRVERIADGLVESKPCYHIRLTKASQICDLWIDRDSWVLRQMTLPLEFLEPAVRQAGDVDQLQFFARFHEAQFAESNTGEFAISIPAGARLVQQLISLPEPFPCESLGETLPQFQLIGSDGESFQIAPDKTDPAILIWVADESPDAVLKPLAELVELGQLNAMLDVDLVFVDLAGWMAEADFTAHASRWQSKARERGLTVRCWRDPGSAALQKLGLKAFPGVIVVGPDTTVQFAQSLAADRWGENLAGALSRIGRGESLAAEMRSDYQHFISRYQRKLQLVSADQLMGRERSQFRAVQKGAILWENLQLARPGNLQRHIAAPDRELLAFDGWRTIVRLDFNGNVIERVTPELPIGEAAAVLRQAFDDHGQTVYLLFAPAARNAYLFDAHWKLVATAHSPAGNTDHILEAQFAANHGDRAAEFWVAFQDAGLQRFDFDGRALGRVGVGRPESFAVREQVCLVCEQGQLTWGTIAADGEVAIDSARTEPTANQGFERVYSLDTSILGTAGDPARRLPVRFYATQADGIGGWLFVDVSTKANAASLDIGSQVFDSTLQPVATNPHLQLVAVADAIGNVQVLNDEMCEVALLSFEQPLSGLALIALDGAPVVIAALPEGIAARRIEPSARAALRE